MPQSFPFRGPEGEHAPPAPIPLESKHLEVVIVVEEIQDRFLAQVPSEEHSSPA